MSLEWTLFLQASCLGRRSAASLDAGMGRDLCDSVLLCAWPLSSLSALLKIHLPEECWWALSLRWCRLIDGGEWEQEGLRHFKCSAPAFALELINYDDSALIEHRSDSSWTTDEPLSVWAKCPFWRFCSLNWCDCHTVVSCNGSTHTVAFLSAWALFPALPTWRSCQRHGSVPGQADFLAARLVNVELSDGNAPARAQWEPLSALWGQDEAPTPVQACVTQIYNSFTRQVSLHYKHVTYFS